jgi:hypothetical protein
LPDQLSGSDSSLKAAPFLARKQFQQFEALPLSDAAAPNGAKDDSVKKFAAVVAVDYAATFLIEAKIEGFVRCRTMGIGVYFIEHLTVGILIKRRAVNFRGPLVVEVLG